MCNGQESAQDGVITRDIHRTFPAHDYFKDSNGDGQDSLYKICKVRHTCSTPGNTKTVSQEEKSVAHLPPPLINGWAGEHVGGAHLAGDKDRERERERERGGGLIPSITRSMGRVT